MLYGLAVLTGAAVPVVLLWRDREVGAVGSVALDPQAVAMLSGGPGRVVDAIVTDLVERGVVLAERGMLTVAPEHAGKLALPFDHPDQDLGMLEAFTLLAVRDGGDGGIADVRQRVCEIRLPFRGMHARLGADRLLVSPLRRRWEPAGVALGVLAVIWVATIGMMYAGTSYVGGLEENENQIALAVLGWLPVTLLVAFLMSRRQGYHGRDPRSALGMAYLAKLRSELPDSGASAQAPVVALGGLEAMPDRALRKAIQGSEPDSTWRSGWEALSEQD